MKVRNALLKVVSVVAFAAAAAPTAAALILSAVAPL